MSSLRGFSLFFEGSEKKVEMVVTGTRSLRSLGGDFWERVVKKADARILSKISSEACDAYLLSESSLFVWDHQFTMITCGQTTLVHAILEFLEEVPLDSVNSLIYERKNEYFPHLQKTNFFEDLELLEGRVPGRAYRFGNVDEHHLFLFHLDKEFKPEPSDSTLEILMYDLQGPARDAFGTPHGSLEKIRKMTGTHRIFPDFHVDDYLFEPLGYSLNALQGSSYYTIHVTPQELGSYVSFETNKNLGEDVDEAVRRVLNVFQPRSFDVIIFRPDRRCEVTDIEGFNHKEAVCEQLECGYGVSFSYYYTPTREIQPAFPLKEKMYGQNATAGY